MSLAAFHPKKLSIFAVLSVADLLLTYQLLQKTGGSVYEGNPIANAWLVAYGWAGLVVFKITAIIVLVSVAGVLSLRQPRLAGEVLTFACVTVGGVVVYSCTLMNWMHRGTDRPDLRPELVARAAPSSEEAFATHLALKHFTQRQTALRARRAGKNKTSLDYAQAAKPDLLPTTSPSLSSPWRSLWLSICNPPTPSVAPAKPAILAEAKPSVRPAVPTMPVALTSN
jgi:hypothetical protein